MVLSFVQCFLSILEENGDEVVEVTCRGWADRRCDSVFHFSSSKLKFHARHDLDRHGQKSEPKEEITPEKRAQNRVDHLVHEIVSIISLFLRQSLLR